MRLKKPYKHWVSGFKYCDKRVVLSKGDEFTKKFILTEDNIWDYADGIDFSAIGSGEITHSFTKEEYLKSKGYPKNCRNYWIKKDGIKRYLRLNVETLEDDNGRIYQEVK